MNPAVETGEILKEISARLREELDYELEARHTRLYAGIFAVGLLGGKAELEFVAGVFAVELGFELFGQAAVAEQKHHRRVGFG